MRYDQLFEGFRNFQDKKKKEQLKEVFDERSAPPPDATPDWMALAQFIESGDYGKALSDEEFKNLIKKAVSVDSEVAEWDRKRVQMAYNDLNLNTSANSSEFEDDPFGELSPISPYDEKH